MSSRLVSAPWRANASFATSRMRSRLRSASARGLRSACCRLLRRWARLTSISIKSLQVETVSAYSIGIGDTLRFIEIAAAGQDHLPSKRRLAPKEKAYASFRYGRDGIRRL